MDCEPPIAAPILRSELTCVNARCESRAPKFLIASGATLDVEMRALLLTFLAGAAALRVPLAARTSLRRSSPPAMLLDGEMPHAGDAEDLEDELLEYAMTFNPYADQADPDQFSGEVSPMASKRDEDDAPMDAEGFARIRERARLRAEGKPLQVWAHGADPADNVETPAHVPTPPSAAQISAADALFATALRSDEPDGFGDFSDEFLENFGV